MGLVVVVMMMNDVVVMKAKDTELFSALLDNTLSRL